MPPFWKSLLGSSSNGASSKGSGSSSTGSRKTGHTELDNSLPSASSAIPRTGSSSSLTAAASKSGTPGGTAKHGSASNARAPISQSASPLTSSKGHQQQQQTSPRKHDNQPGHGLTNRSGTMASSVSSSNGSTGSGLATSGQQPMLVGSASSTSTGPASAPIGIPISQTTSNTTSVGTPSVGGYTSGASTSAGDEDEDEVPATPYSSGHSPSHARHKFPTAAKPEQDIEEGSELEEANESVSQQSRSTEVTQLSKSYSSNLSKSNTSVTGSPANQSSRPSIPTTQTILANPIAQPSSGLAAAISSVLPSSSGGGGTSNGKAAAAADASRTFDIDDMISRLLEAGYGAKLTKAVCLKNSEITALCSAAREVFLSQPTLIELSPPVKIVGDVHGQYSDLIRLFEMCGFPPKSNYLFLGDYVDRGKQSLETILLLLCYKVKYPENFFLLRGNHECANVTRVYGFYDECKRRCNIKIWKTFIDVFNCLPITALVAGKIFCVHGGLSPSLSNMDDIRRIARPTDVPDYGLLNDLLWSDPSDTALDWEDNERGVSYCFGKAVIQDFLAKYDFDLICRAHMVVEDGYEFWNERTLVTIFSAPNYCGEFDNFGAVMSVSEDLLCAFELLKPLDGPALKKELLKSKRKNSAAITAGQTLQ